MKRELWAIIKKDLKAVTASRRMLASLLIVPLVLTIFIPTVFILTVWLAPGETADFQQLLALLPVSNQAEDIRQTIMELIINYIIPVFFLIIPIMASSIMAASSFVGEKEKRTLETLLYCPLSVKEIFQAKVLASFLLSMAVSLISFAAMVLAVEGEAFIITGSWLALDLNWLLILLLVAPSISMIAITLIVRMSARAKTAEDAQQGAVFLILPVLLLMVGQFAGVMLISPLLLLGIGILFLLLAWILLKKAVAGFTYEMLLK